MHDQRTPERTPDQLERDVLYLLTIEAEPIWSVNDLGRAVEDPTDVVDAIAGLLRAGLIHKTSDGFVFATHAGYRSVAMIGSLV